MTIGLAVLSAICLGYGLERADVWHSLAVWLGLLLMVAATRR